MRVLSHGQPNAAALFARYFADKQQVIASVWEFNNFQWELGLLNEAESILPDSVLFNLHFDMIVNKGREAVTEYHKNLVKGKNLILEKVRPHLTLSDSQALTESINRFIDERKKKLALILEAQAGAIDPLTQINANTAGSVISAGAAGTDSDSGSSGLMSIVKSIWDSISENGSWYGILHLVLDLIGLFGDIPFPGLGSAADIVNALIYLVRYLTPGGPEGMGTLAIISAISAIPFAGDVAKLFKYGKRGKAALRAEALLRAGARGGEKAYLAAMKAVPVNERSLVISFLRMVAKYSTKIASWFTQGVGFLSKWVLAKVGSVFGSKISKFFDDLGQKVIDWGKDLNRFSETFGNTQKALIKAELKQADDLLKVYRTQKKGKFEYIADTDTVKLYDDAGKLMGEYAATLVERSKLWRSDFPKTFPSKKQAKQAAADYESLLSRSGRETVSGIRAKFGRKIKNWTFWGKQVFKLIGVKPEAGEDLKDYANTEDSGLIEIEANGANVLNDFIEYETKRIMKETGAEYVPSVTLGDDPYGVNDPGWKAIDAYQNSIAKTLGMPTIGHVVYNRFKNDEELKEVNQFFEDMRSGKIIRGEDGAWIPNPNYKESKDSDKGEEESDDVEVIKGKKDEQPVDRDTKEEDDQIEVIKKVKEEKTPYVLPFSKFKK